MKKGVALSKMLIWIKLIMYTKGAPVRNLLTKAKANKFSVICIQEWSAPSVTSNLQQLREGWLRQFMECHRLSSVGLHGKTLFADSLAVKPFR